MDAIADRYDLEESRMFRKHVADASASIGGFINGKLQLQAWPMDKATDSG